MLHAHITKALDLTKEIHPLAEALTLQHIEASLELSFAKAYPVVTKDEQTVNITEKWINQLRACILYDTPPAEQDNKALQAKIALWKALNNK